MISIVMHVFMHKWLLFITHFFLSLKKEEVNTEYYKSLFTMSKLLITRKLKIIMNFS